MEKFNDQEIQQKIVEVIAEWQLKENFLHREFVFKDFIEAFSFMTSIAFVAEKLGHHPNWTNEYNKVIFNLNTHDTNGITDKDLQLAVAIDKIYKKSK